jgi:hypothetical protein
MELALRDLKPYCGVGDDQCQTLLAIHRVVHLALTAFCLWRLTLLQEQQAPWLSMKRTSPAGELTALSFQRLHRALRRLVWQRIFAAFAPGTDCQNTEVSYEQIFRIAASHHDLIVIPGSAERINFCEGIVNVTFHIYPSIAGYAIKSNACGVGECRESRVDQGTKAWWDGYRR